MESPLNVILSLLDAEPIENSLTLVEVLGIDHSEVVGLLNKLQASGYVTLESISSEKVLLTEEAQSYLENGMPEVLLFEYLTNGMPVEEAKNHPSYHAGWRILVSQKICTVSAGAVVLEKENFEDTFSPILRRISNGENFSDEELKKLKKRKLVVSKTVKSFVVQKGTHFSLEYSKGENDLTSQMIQDGSWKEQVFKPFNLDSISKIESGHLHPLMKVREEYRQIFLELGFEEMPTNTFVESSFWNFDALFQPQLHPARDAHDTFFLNSPKETLSLPDDYVEKVKETHENGGDCNSTGWRYQWSLEEAKKNILRTHTTAVSSKMLYKLAQDGFQPKKYFSIDRVFRNETLDATHLAEFHQIEGLVADYDLSIRDLMGMMETFFNKIGIEKLRFKPAYNPYTEPSMEVFGYHEGLQKWIEVGNSGVFRPEMLLPMGLPERVNVIAWGLSLERPTMIKYKLDNIRDLVGYKTKLSFITENPLCRMDEV
jgi:phenylalanyl-tRNA synthetase alpha chain